MKIGDYKVLSLRFASTNSACHYIYLKEHSVREKTEDKPAGRTLFIINIPCYATESSIERIFSVAGEVVDVHFTQRPTNTSTTNSKIKDQSTLFPTDVPLKSFRVAYVIFQSVAGLQNALELKSLEPLSSDEHPISTGLQKWIKEYNDNIPNVEALQNEIDLFMNKFDHDATNKIEKEKSLAEPDDEGWVTVTKRGRNPGFSRKESVENKILNKDKTRKRKTQLLNFYSFQVKESKMKHLVTLRKKFEEDKKRIELLKQSRRFRPF